MSRRPLLIVLALIALAAVLYIVLRGDGDPAGAPATTAGGDRVAAGGVNDPSTIRSSDRPRVPPGTNVVVPPPGGAAVGSDGQPIVAQPDPTLERSPQAPARTSVSDTGNPIRDHRSDTTREAVDLPAPVAPAARTMSSTISAELAQKLAPIVRECGAKVPDDARGTDPTIHVTLNVHITGGQLGTDDATAVTSGIKAPASAEVIACVRDRAAGLTATANGEPDRTDYIAQFPFRLRK